VNIGKGVLWDHGAGKAIRFAISADLQSGEYEAIKVHANGRDYACDENYKAIRYKGRAVGRLEIYPLDRAATLGIPPAKEVETIATPLPPGAVQQGIEDYGRLYKEIRQFRGDSRRCAETAWDKYLDANPFLDSLVIRKRTIPTT
jgi:hypothetical protein